MHIEYGYRNGQTGQRGLVGGARRAVQQANVRGGSTHVETDGALEPELLRQPRGGHHATRWSGEDGADGLLPGARRRGNSPVRLHHVNASVGWGHAMAYPYSAQPVLQVVEVRAHARGEIGVDDHGGKAFEL